MELSLLHLNRSLESQLSVPCILFLYFSSYAICIVCVLVLSIGVQCLVCICIPSLESNLNKTLAQKSFGGCSFFSAHPLSSLSLAMAFKWEDNSLPTMFPDAFQMHSDEEIILRLEEEMEDLVDAVN